MDAKAYSWWLQRDKEPTHLLSKYFLRTRHMLNLWYKRKIKPDIVPILLNLTFSTGNNYKSNTHVNIKNVYKNRWEGTCQARSLKMTRIDIILKGIHVDVIQTESFQVSQNELSLRTVNITSKRVQWLGTDCFIKKNHSPGWNLLDKLKAQPWHS